MPRFASGWVRLTDEGPLVPQSQFSTLLLVVGASSGGVVTAAPDRPGEGEHWVDRVLVDLVVVQPDLALGLFERLLDPHRRPAIPTSVTSEVAAGAKQA